MKLKIAAAAFAAALVASAFSAPASAQVRRSGVLVCDLAPTVGLLIGSSQEVVCRHGSRRRGARYVGRINRLGVDLGVREGGRLVWAVMLPPRTPRRPLVGDYFGAAGDASIGVGVGANALVGGFNRSVVLQPLSIEATRGLNLAFGVASLSLR